MTAPLHILIGNNIYPPFMAGGAELIVSYLAEGLVERGHQVTVISTCGPEMEPYPIEMRNGVEILRFFPKNLYWHWERKPHPAWMKALWHMRDAWNFNTGSRFKKILGDRRPDVLHTHLIDGMSAMLWQQAKASGMGVIHTAHDYHLMCPRSVMLSKSQKICNNPSVGCKMYRGWHLSTTKYVDVFCSPSNFLIEKHKKEGLHAKRTAVVNNGIPLPAPEPKVRAADAPVRFLFPARHTIEKGCLVLLEAVKKLLPDLNFELLVAGKGPLEDKFHEAAAADSRIKMLGYISGDTKTATFRQADCILVPSLWYENAPVVIVEAAAYGMGVIGSNIGALPEFIKHEKTGLLFEPGNATDMAAAMERVIREKDLLPKFAQEAQTLVKVSSVEAMVNSYLEQYRSVI